MQLLNSLVARIVPLMPRALVHTISQRYIAGETLADAVKRMRALNAQGYAVTVDVLGESITHMHQADGTANAYVEVLQAIGEHGLEATISVKPTALGLLLDRAHCDRALGRLATEAASRGTAICIDMEDSRCTQAQIEQFTRLASGHANVSLALQAYLRRTDADLDLLLDPRGSLRICKGIYREEAIHLVDGAGRDRQAINVHFLRHVARCFKAGTFVAIATHDQALIDAVLTVAHAQKVDRTRFEFQMLLGVCEPMRDALRDAGYQVRIYVPYGEDWYGYSTRRMKENPQIAGYVLRAILRR
jgi:proline dehydrogenase